MRLIGLDTNFLAYLAGVDRSETDKGKIANSRKLIAQLAGQVEFIITAQALGELFVVLTRAGTSREEAQSLIKTFSDGMVRVGTTAEIFDKALALSVDHKLQIWDSLIMTASAEAGCTVLLSEDMHHGFRMGSITIINPFVEPAHPQLLVLLPEA
jgi:predicted nucleic acid-binding protein